MVSIKRNFYSRNIETRVLDQLVEASKGIYATIRMSDNINIPNCAGLGVNVDVANTTFWIGQHMEQLVRAFVTLQEPRFRSSK